MHLDHGDVILDAIEAWVLDDLPDLPGLLKGVSAINHPVSTGHLVWPECRDKMLGHENIPLTILSGSSGRRTR